MVVVGSLGSRESALFFFEDIQHPKNHVGEQKGIRDGPIKVVKGHNLLTFVTHGAGERIEVLCQMLKAFLMKRQGLRGFAAFQTCNKVLDEVTRADKADLCRIKFSGGHALVL